MSGVLDTDLTALAYEPRLAALRDRGVGLWDVVASARRVGSTDAAIRDLSPNDLAALVASLPTLRAVAFNGGTALKHGVPRLGAFADGALNACAIVALPSSSPLHTVGLAAKQPAWDQLKTFLA